MPWGIRRDHIEATLRRWAPSLRAVTITGYAFPRGPERYVAAALERIPFTRNNTPAIVEARL